jgi:pilus assembly protein Flp/PilA
MLNYWMTWLRSTVSAEEGQGLVEYALIIVLIAIALIAVLTLLAGGVGSTFSSISSSLTDGVS